MTDTNTPTDRDQLLFDIFVTAIEGGVQYWADVTAYHHWDANDGEDLQGFTAVIEDNESGDPDDRWTVNRKVIAKGYRLATSAEWRNKLAWSSEKPPIVVTEDGWDCDAGDADMIVQLGLFGDVVYG